VTKKPDIIAIRVDQNTVVHLHMAVALMAPVGKPLKHDIPAQLFRLNRIRDLRLTNCVGFSWNTELSRKPVLNSQPIQMLQINIPNSTESTGPHSVKPLRKKHKHKPRLPVQIFYQVVWEHLVRCV
jgi:hypothetical protein